MHSRSLLAIPSLLLILTLFACNLSAPPGETQEQLATWVAATLTALETMPAFPTLTPVPPQDTLPATPPTSSNTPLPIPTSTPLNPLVLETTLCWEGPGARFEVVSALKKDERVVLLGRPTISGWWVVDNPIYHDPCWVQANHLQIEPGTNISLLPVFTPPPTPTFTPTDTRTPTNTPVFTNTPTFTNTP